MVKIIKTSIVVYTSAQRQKTNPSSYGMSTNISSSGPLICTNVISGCQKDFLPEL